ICSWRFKSDSSFSSYACSFSWSNAIGCGRGQLYLRVLTRQGPAFSVFFDPSGKASLLSEAEAGIEPQQELRQGRWQHFPEGTAVKWKGRRAGDGDTLGDFGLISGCGGSVIYEGYDDHSSEKPNSLRRSKLETTRPAHRICNGL
ncbi:MAG: hypothetical protein ACXW3T_11680, partial [Rhodoplanes sp.]